MWEKEWVYWRYDVERLRDVIVFGKVLSSLGSMWS